MDFTKTKKEKISIGYLDLSLERWVRWSVCIKKKVGGGYGVIESQQENVMISYNSSLTNQKKFINISVSITFFLHYPRRVWLQFAFQILQETSDCDPTGYTIGDRCNFKFN